MTDEAITQTGDAEVTRGTPQRALRTFAVCISVAFSLLCFPHWLPWMVAFWIVWHSIRVYQGYPGYWPLFACTAILAVRLVPHTPAMLLLAALLVVAAVRRFRRRGSINRTGPERWIGVTVLWIAWGLMFVEYRHASSHSHRLAFAPDRPIVCIGDSLTQGMIPDRGYPGKLEPMVNAQVINKGVSGVSTSPAIGILERALQHRPQAVIIELGGHDFLKWHTRSSTKANLVKLITLCRENDCEPILMEIPRGFMVDPYASLERELAYEYDLQLIDDRWLRHIVLMSPAAPPGMWMPSAQLSDDGIHSNPRGSQAIAEFVVDALVQVYGEDVLR